MSEVDILAGFGPAPCPHRYYLCGSCEQLDAKHGEEGWEESEPGDADYPYPEDEIAEEEV